MKNLHKNEVLYIDWFNNYLTVERMAEDYNIVMVQFMVLLNNGKARYFERTTKQ